MSAYFSPAALRFLRSLGRHNHRDWFQAHKAAYLAEVHAPMVRLCDDVAQAMAGFAPGHVQPTSKAMMRIYENMRFHSDRPPFKTQLGVWWGRRGVARTSGAGYYLHLDGQGMNVSAGCYRPSPEQLLAIRTEIARDPARLRALLAGSKLKKLLPRRFGATLQRAPKGFSEADPALDLIRCTQWGCSSSLPADVVVGPRLLAEVVRRFAAATPLVNYLNPPVRMQRPFSLP